MMDPLVVMICQTVLSFIAFALIIKWYVLPWVSRLPLEDALVLLTWPHVFRFVALTAFLPGQVAADVVQGPLSLVVYGDTISALLALLSIVMLRYRLNGALWTAWIFNIFGFADWVQSQVQHMRAESFLNEIGASALVYVLYVPPLVITHVVMLYWLAMRQRRQVPNPILTRRTTPY